MTYIIISKLALAFGLIVITLNILRISNEKEVDKKSLNLNLFCASFLLAGYISVRILPVVISKIF